MTAVHRRRLFLNGHDGYLRAVPRVMLISTGAVVSGVVWVLLFAYLILLALVGLTVMVAFALFQLVIGPR